jgi:hypothetical protein
MNPQNYTHLIFDKCAKNIWWRKDSFFNECYWEKWLPIHKKLKLDPCISPFTSIHYFISDFAKLDLFPSLFIQICQGSMNLVIFSQNKPFFFIDSLYGFWVSI